MSSQLLESLSLGRLASLQLQARTIAEGALAGLHRSAHHGASVEFAEHKEYAPGDELRHIDWRAFGRMDKYYVKRFEEETELRAYMLVDASGSMGYGREGGPTKLRYASLLGAALAYLLLRQNDQAGLLCFGPQRVYLPPRGHGAHLSDVCAALEALTPDGGGDLVRTLAYLSEVMRRRSLVVLFSDLLPGPEGVDAGPVASAAQVRARLKGLRARRHDVIVLHLLDPDELALPFEGPTWFEDMEEGPLGRRRLLCDPADVRRAYKEELGRFLEEMRRGLRESDVDYHLVSTDTPPERVLFDLLTGPLRGQVRR